MARSASLDSANSQFFIVYDDASFLNGQYTLFGKVIEGMEFVDQIRKGNEASNGQVDNPDHVVSMRLQGGP
jgi:peptidylprolyl isomerase